MVEGKEGRGIVYVKHIPHGFFEEQLKEYFKQFGHVTRLRLSRSKKTGRSKGYAFVEFASSSVAQIAAKSMEDYLMFRQRLMCKYLDPTEVHPDVFKGANRPFSKPKAAAIARERHNRALTGPKQIANIKRLRSKTVKALSTFKELGINYDLPGLDAQVIIPEKSDMDTSTNEKSTKKRKADIPLEGVKSKKTNRASTGDTAEKDIVSLKVIEKKDGKKERKQTKANKSSIENSTNKIVGEEQKTASKSVSKKDKIKTDTTKTDKDNAKQSPVKTVQKKNKKKQKK